MKFILISLIVFALLLIVVTLQNTDIVSVKLFFWEIHLPRALVIFPSFLIGLIIGLFIPIRKRGLPGKNKNEPFKSDVL